MSELHLSKSKYCSGAQCPKMLWLKEHKPEEFDDSVMNQTILDTGNKVGDMAMGLFGEFTEVPFDKENLQSMIDTTEELIKKGTGVIAEASFSVDNNFCSVDILKNLGNNRVEMYEVKCSTSAKPIYKHDVCFQYYVLTKCGYKVERACLVHINNKYERHGKLDLSQFFHIEDFTALAQNSLKTIENNVTKMREYVGQENEPSKNPDAYCFNPYDCGFFNYCSRNLPHPNIFDVHRIMTDTKISCYKQGIISFPDIIRSNRLNEKAMVQVRFGEKERKPLLNRDNISAFLDTLHYPLYFLDFDIDNPAIPLYDYQRPYEQMPFGYSLHVLEYNGGELEYRECRPEEGKDPRRIIAERLVSDITPEACLITCNIKQKGARLRRLAELYPDLGDKLTYIGDSFHDLTLPFYNNDYYIKAFNGSYALEDVYKALFPDDPAPADSSGRTFAMVRILDCLKRL